jgi:hypothetical protein
MSGPEECLHRGHDLGAQRRRVYAEGNQMLESYGWKLLGVEKANPAPADYHVSDEVADMLERTRANKNAISYGTFHTYPVM